MRVNGEFRLTGFERARRGRFRFASGRGGGVQIQTPCFMPVGTQGSVRSQRMQDISDLDAPIILGNTLHLMRKPGLETLRDFGGLHKLIGWKRAILTDSGGYQVFSLSKLSVLDEKGVRFKIDERERELFLSPEVSIAAQLTIGSDIMMAFDQCIPSTASLEQAREAMERTHRWAERSLAARPTDATAALFGIVQGACHRDLRRESALVLSEMAAREGGFDGLAIGGLAVGESKSEREDMTAWTEQFMPVDRARYLMGVGTPIDLLEAVARGVDLFDCVLPTMLAQQGVAFTRLGKIDLRRGVYRLQDQPLDSQCACATCATHSRAYLRHLIRAREVSGWSAIAAHNLHFYTRFMGDVRAAMDAGAFAEFYRRERERVGGQDLEAPVTPPKAKSLAASPAPSTQILGAFEVVRGPEGDYKIAHRASGEWMHSKGDSLREAMQLYVEQTGVIERWCAHPGPEPFVVWDVGLGAATNAMALLQAADQASQVAAPLLLVSFENDLDALRLALAKNSEDPSAFSHLSHPAPRALLTRQKYSQTVGTTFWEWRLLEGDFAKRAVQAPAPDLIFYDPFSFKTDAPLWEESWFRRMREPWGARAVELVTYSRATRVRERLRNAGWRVEKGQPIVAADGRVIKEQTTRAFTT